ILAQIAPLLANFLLVALAARLTKLALVLRDVARIVPNVALVLRDVAAIVPHVASVLTKITPLLGALAQLAPLLLGERLRCRRAGRRGGSGKRTRSRAHKGCKRHHGRRDAWHTHPPRP